MASVPSFSVLVVLMSFPRLAVGLSRVL